MGEINAYDKIIIENEKKTRKHGNQRNCSVNFHLKGGLGMEFMAC